jgi:hypothetical protein
VGKLGRKLGEFRIVGELRWIVGQFRWIVGELGRLASPRLSRLQRQLGFQRGLLLCIQRRIQR